MRSDKIVQFVRFDTTLTSELFIKQWEQYSRSVNSDVNATLQQSEKNGVFNYLAQHRFDDSAFQFFFTKGGRSIHNAEVEIKTRQAGGYSILQLERTVEAADKESKVFAFITNPQTDLNGFRQLNVQNKLNIYEAYFENCQYAFILEYFVSDKNATNLLEQLKANGATETRIYKSCLMLAA